MSSTRSSTPLRVAVDAMSGDNGLDAVVGAVRLCLQRHGDVELLLVGDESALRSALAAAGLENEPRLRVQHASEVVTMEDLPSRALRAKKDSSMRVAVNLLHRGEAHATVSAGNTGALMAIARFVLKTLPGIDRPAIISALPARQGHTYLLDLGANAACSPEHLFEFAVMGSVLAQAVDGKPAPRVALLNIGEEELKGVEVIHKAQELLRASRLNYVGYVEANDLFGHEADVVVSDGFVGNVALKSAEGAAGFIKDMIRQAFSERWWSRLAGAVAQPVLQRLGARIDPRMYNGASLLGLRGVVIKSHGGADSVAFAHALDVAILEARSEIPQRIGEGIARELESVAASTAESA